LATGPFCSRSQFSSRSQLVAAIGPVGLKLVRLRRSECVCKAAPSYIARECTLFVRRGAPRIEFDIFECFDGRDVIAEFWAFRTFAEFKLVGNSEVSSRDVGLYPTCAGGFF
jgi:hypothetical protein